MKNFRTISLATDKSKILARIVYRGMEQRAEEYLDDNKFEYR